MRRRWRERYGDVAIVWLNACVLFALLNLVAGVAHWYTRPPGLEPNDTMIARAHPHLDARDVAQLVAESNRDLAYEPYTDMTDPPVTGRFVNIDAAGFRVSKDQGPWPPDAGRRNVFVFGGSTAFGYGVADADTIASYLQPMLPDADGRRPAVYNFGHSGYYSTQERILFERLVVAGHRPDTAVFIDGLNDFVAVDDRPSTAHRLEHGYRRAGEPPLRTVLYQLPITVTVLHLGRLLGAAPPAPVSGPEPLDGADDVARILERYRHSKATIAAAGAAHGIRTLFVWQPIPVYRFPPRTGHANAGPNRWRYEGYDLMRGAAARRELGDDFVWCADVAADGTPEFYVDVVHYAPVLSERVARCISEGMAGRGVVPTPY